MSGAWARTARRARDGEKRVQDLMTAAYDKFRAAPGGWAGRWNAEGLTNREKVAVIFGNFNYQIENGGLVQWVDNGYAELDGRMIHRVLAAVAAMHRDLDPAAADLLVEIMRHIEEAPDRHAAPTVIDVDVEVVDGEEVEYEVYSKPDDAFFEHVGSGGFEPRYFTPEMRLRMIAFYGAVVRRWPETLDPFEAAGPLTPAPGGAKAVPAPRASGVRYPDVVLPLVGEDGNAVALIAAARKALRNAGVVDEEIERFTAEARSGDYDGVLATCMRWGRIGHAEEAAPAFRP